MATDPPTQDQPQQQPPPTQQQQQQAPPPPTQNEPQDRRTREEMRAELAAERVSAAHQQRTLEARAAKAEADLAAANTAAEGRVTTEVTKVTEKLTKMQQRLMDAELKAGASAAGLRDPDLLLHPLLDRTKIILGEDGEVTGVAEAFADLKTKKPEWFGTVAPPPGTPPPPARSTGGPAPQPGSANPPPTNVKEFKTKGEYEAHKKDFLKGLRSA